MFYLPKEALKHMKEGDCIINSTSVTNYRGSRELLDYSSTKGAITAFTRSLGKNLAKKGIRVNGVCHESCRQMDQECNLMKQRRWASTRRYEL